jgi:hypothetical protein
MDSASLAGDPEVVPAGTANLVDSAPVTVDVVKAALTRDTYPADPPSRSQTYPKLWSNPSYQTPSRFQLPH